MNPDTIDQFARAHIEIALKARGLGKTDLGRGLAQNQELTPQQAFQIGARILQGKTPLTLKKLTQIAHFLDQPLLDFFPPEIRTPHSLNSPADQAENLAQYEMSLRAIGLDEDLIKANLRQMRASIAYNEVDEQ